MNARAHIDQSKQIAALRQENDELRERLRQLMEEMGVTMAPPSVFRFAPQESRIFGVLMKRGAVSGEQLLSAAYADRFAEDLPGAEIIKVLICKMRRKLDLFGINITTIWGHGYMLSPEAKERARRLMTAEAGEVRS